MAPIVHKTLIKVSAAVLYSLKAQHSIFNDVDTPELERFVLQIYASAPAHIKFALGCLSIYINMLGILVYLRPTRVLSLKQVSTLVNLMDASSLGAIRAYSRFMFNIVALGSLSETHHVS